MTLEETISAIRPGDPAARDAARRWWDPVSYTHLTLPTILIV